MKAKPTWFTHGLNSYAAVLKSQWSTWHRLALSIGRNCCPGRWQSDHVFTVTVRGKKPWEDYVKQMGKSEHKTIPYDVLTNSNALSVCICQQNRLFPSHCRGNTASKQSIPSTFGMWDGHHGVFLILQLLLFVLKTCLQATNKIVAPLHSCAA